MRIVIWLITLMYNMAMKESSGLTTEDAQRAICKGTYGGKEWSSEERQAACLKSNEVYDPSATGSSTYVNVVLISAGVLLVTACIVVFYLKFRQKRLLLINKKHSTKKRS